MISIEHLMLQNALNGLNNCHTEGEKEKQYKLIEYYTKLLEDVTHIRY